MKRTIALGLCLLLPSLGFAQREIAGPPPTHRIEAPDWLNRLEPAGGGTTSTPAATGNSSPQKSFAGKEIGAPPPLPTVKIGGVVVARTTDLTRSAEEASTPTELKRRDFAQVLSSRLPFTAFAHSPHIGPTHAPITVVVFEDLSCISCTEASQGINAALADVLTSPTTPTSNSLAGMTRVIWMHATNARFQPNNLPAFYSKVAGQYGTFWAFRAALLNAPDREPNTLFNLLAAQGIEPRIIRQVMLTEARRYYRELDGDVMQNLNFGIGSPPFVMVNGIRVGQSGIPLSLLPDVLTYVQNRHNAGLNEPPL
jgi:hypothetical protein